MDSEKSNVLELAKKGSPKAISALINRQIQHKGITAKVSLKDECLQVMFESEQVPNQAGLVAFLRKGLENLKIERVREVKVYGRKINEEFPSWDYKFELLQKDYSRHENNSSSKEKYEDQRVRKSSADQAIYFEAIGKNGKIRLTQKRVLISREGFWGFMSQGLAGTKEIPISKITAIQFKPAGQVTAGYLQFSIIGGIEAKGGIFNAVNDENTVVFEPGQQSNFEEIKKYIDSVIYDEPIDISLLTYTPPSDDLEKEDIWNKKIEITKYHSQKKLIAGLCGIFLGWLGIHKFILGYSTEGFIMLGMTFITIGILAFIPAILGLIEGVIYLSKKDNDFKRIYIDNKKSWL